jgi:hypothetical protein
MYAIESNLLANYNCNLFKEGSFILTALQKKVATVALVIFSCAVAWYVLYQIGLRANNREFSELNKEKAISNSDLVNPVQEEVSEPVETENPVFEKGGKLYASLCSGKEELNNWVDITFKNVSNIKDARIILIGEDHTISEHYEIESYIIRHLGKAHDILLLEGCEGKVETSSSKLQCMDAYGWDDLKWFPRSIIKNFFKMVDEHQEKKSNDPKYKEEMDRKIIKIYEELMYSGHKRNEMLVRTLNDHCLKWPNKKIFLIAGQLHLIQANVYNVLHYLPSEEKCALVMLKCLRNLSMAEIRAHYNV